jgi:PAS domain S-box-containing protein
MLRDKWAIWESHIPQILWSATPDGGLDFINTRWTEYSGQTMADACPTGWFNAVHPEDQPATLENWQRALSTGEPYETLFRLRSKAGAYRAHIARAMPLRAHDGQIIHWYGTCTDVEDQRRAHDALIKTEKLAAAGRLSASIAHEINNPLESVTNLLYLAAMDTTAAADKANYLHLAQVELARVSQIVTHTLRFHRQSTHRVPCRLSGLMETVVLLFEARLRNANITLVHDSRETRTIEGFDGELRQVFANLVGNAIDAMRANGGTLTSRVTDATRDGRPGVRTTVADDGSGMDRATRARMFEAFFTTKPEIGTGLGLWLSKEIIEKHHGVVSCKSSTRELRHGTVFSIFWPC